MISWTSDEIKLMSGKIKAKKAVSERIKELLTLLLWVGLSPVLQFLTGRRRGGHHKHYFLYSLFPRLDFLLPLDSVMRSFSSFLNWGYYPSNDIHLYTEFVSKLPASQHKFPVGAFHYHRLLEKGRPNNKSLLEVGCGKGSGCKYIIDHFYSPQHYVGLDVSSQLIQVCKGHNLENNYEFLVGSALALPFDSHSFDIVLNVESSHCYPSFKKFLREVERVLRPGGLFLFTDLRWGVESQITKTLERQLNSTTLELVSLKEITENIIAARKIVSEHITLVDRLVFQYNSTIAAHYCLEGSPTLEMLKNGTISYFEAILQKK